MLTELGFSNSGEIHKKRHPENTICLWWLALKDWKEPVVEKPVEKVENPFGKVDNRNNFLAPQEQKFYVVDAMGNKKSLINGHFRKPIFGVPPRPWTDSQILAITGHTFQWHSHRRNAAGWGPLNKLVTV